MSNIKSLNLKFNPFKEVSANSMKDVIWAGMEDIKSKVQRSYDENIREMSKQIVLNWGPYGGGKTFSAFYFANKEKELKNVTHIYIRTPQDGSKAVDEFFSNIIDALTFDIIQAQISNALKKYSQQEFIKLLTPVATKEFAKAISLIGSDNEDTTELMNRYLYSGLTKAELKKLGLAKGVQSDLDSIKLLSGILFCFIGNEEIFDGQIIMWIDEMENLIYYSVKNYKSFSQIIRDLFDSIPDRILVFLNFTLAEGEENIIEEVLGGALWSRITRKIRYKQLNIADAEKYCNDLLRNAKEDNSIDKPFSRDMLKEVLGLISPSDLTPREINKYFNSLINYSLDHNISNINQRVLNSWMQEYGDDN